MSRFKTTLILSMVLLASLPSLAHGSDFSGIAYFVLAIIVGVTVACLIAGAMTAAVLVAVTKRRWIWWLLPFFAACWFGVGWVLMDLLSEAGVL